MATNDEDTYTLNGITWKRISFGLWAALDREGNLLLNSLHPGTGDDDRPPSLTIKQEHIEHLVDYLNIDLGIEPKNANPPTSALDARLTALELEVRGQPVPEGVASDGLRSMLDDAGTALSGIVGEVEGITKHVAALQETMNTVMARKPAVPDGLATRDWVEGRLSTLSAALRTFFKSELAKREITLSDRARLAWRALRGQASPIANADGTRAAGYTPEQVSALGASAAAAAELARAEKGGVP